ncbi:MAG TPA: sugar ABC transporter permease [Methylomirabilota bacterium]
MSHGAGGRRRSELRPGPLALWMNLPAVTCLTVVLAYPIGYAGYLSLHEVSLRQLRSGEFPWAGLGNFRRLLEDGVFWLSLRHTVEFVAASVGLEVVIALGIALVIDEERVWISRVTRALILLPWAVPPVVNGLLWSFIFNAQYGYLNRTLHALGAIDTDVNWLGTPSLAMATVITAYVWRTTPFNVLLYHAALQGLPAELYEAADVDGASGWQRFWSITLPLLLPVITVSLVLRTTFAFMVFDEILAITQGGPGNATWVAAWFTYKVSFQPPFNIGLGAASAWALALIVGAISFVYVRFLYRRVEL